MDYNKLNNLIRSAKDELSSAYCFANSSYIINNPTEIKAHLGAAQKAIENAFDVINGVKKEPPAITPEDILQKSHLIHPKKILSEGMKNALEDDFKIKLQDDLDYDNSVIGKLPTSNCKDEGCGSIHFEDVDEILLDRLVGETNFFNDSFGRFFEFIADHTVKYVKVCKYTESRLGEDVLAEFVLLFPYQAQKSITKVLENRFRTYLEEYGYSVKIKWSATQTKSVYFSVIIQGSLDKSWEAKKKREDEWRLNLNDANRRLSLQDMSFEYAWEYSLCLDEMNRIPKDESIFSECQKNYFATCEAEVYDRKNSFVEYLTKAANRLYETVDDAICEILDAENGKRLPLMAKLERITKMLLAELRVIADIAIKYGLRLFAKEVLKKLAIALIIAAMRDSKSFEMDNIIRNQFKDALN